MGRRSDHSREQLNALAIAAARDLAEQEGMAGLTARRIAGRIGYSAGTLYNLFGNLDELLLTVNGGTLDALYGALTSAPLSTNPEDALRQLAERYIRFACEHENSWTVLFEANLPEGQVAPDEYREKVVRPLRLVADVLAPLFGPGMEDERFRCAQVLWSSLHGLYALKTSNKLVGDESIDVMFDNLIAHYVAGLRANQS